MPPAFLAGALPYKEITLYDYYETAAVDNAKNLQANLFATWGVSIYDPQMRRQAEKTIELARESWSARVNAAVGVAQAVLDHNRDTALAVTLR
ncbi:hypothetical protein FNU79_18885 [Deinococcus detaillensis]|uniref:Uncharacterized protein n=1 Tax=Deinococcus detaillensis TaxID=2592048 RepID=A0A553UEU3_9DEIO|nr:hypothetical protein [Deinococcus detaillensis]TSA78551.1 hypothetical protein FNU79_18885 [Deinococcus detaillensis]